MYVSRGKKVFKTKPTGRPLSDPEARFLKKLDIRELHECWEWMGSANPDGYGKFSVGSNSNIRTHRFAYELTFGAIPQGMVVMHTCDNPPCCNPAHLSLGTQQDNMRDKCSKARHARGQMNGSAKLTEAQVTDIRERLSRRESQVAIAALYGITQANVSYIKLRLGWRHVA